MKKKKIFFRIVIIVIIYFIILGIYIMPNNFFPQTEFHHLLSYLINLNQIKIKIDKNIDKSKLIIKWNNEIIYNNKQIISKNIKKVRYFYGINTFTILYDNKMIAKYSQFKENNWYYHKYIFIIKKINNEFNCKLNITGTCNYARALHITASKSCGCN